MKKQSIISLIFVLFFMAGATAQVLEPQTQDSTLHSSPKLDIGVAIGLKANTLGAGGEVIVQLKPRIHLRLGASYFSYLFDIKSVEDVIDASGKVQIGGANLLANFHFGRIFFLSAGGIYNFTKIEAGGFSSKPLYVGSVEVSPEDVGRMDLSVKPQLAISPYFGLGLGRAISKNHRVSFAFELGTTYIKQPFADFETTGMLKPTSSQEQVDQLNENLSWIYFYPIINFQLGYRIF